MSKHTPGPWKADDAGQIVWAENPYGHGYMMIADIRGWGHLTGTGACNLPENEAVAIQDANMNLVAAAPDLFEAIKMFLNAEKHEHQETRLTTDELKAIKMMRQAIVKAEDPKRSIYCQLNEGSYCTHCSGHEHLCRQDTNKTEKPA